MNMSKSRSRRVSPKKNLTIEVENLNYEDRLYPQSSKARSYNSLQQGLLTPSHEYYVDYRRKMLKLAEELDERAPFTEEMINFFFKNNYTDQYYDEIDLISVNDEYSSLSESDYSIYYDSDENDENDEIEEYHESDMSEDIDMNSSFNSVKSYL